MRCPSYRGRTKVRYAYRRCAYYNRGRINDIRRILDKLDVVVFSQRMSAKRIKPMQETFELFSRYGVKIVVLGAGPWFRENVVPMIANHGSMFELDAALNAKSRNDHYIADEELLPFVTSLGGDYIKKREFFCPNDVCRIVMSDGYSIMYDKHHLTMSAAREFGRYLVQKNPDLLEIN